MRESSPNLISQLLLVIEIRIFENLLLCQMVTSSNIKTVFLLVLEDQKELRAQIWRGLEH